MEALLILVVGALAIAILILADAGSLDAIGDEIQNDPLTCGFILSMILGVVMVLVMVS